MRKENELKTYVNIRDWIDPTKLNAPAKPKFFIGEKQFGTIGGIINGVGIEHKKITPSTGTNAGKEITVHNLLVDMVDDEGEMTLQINLYSQLARNVINALAGPLSFDKEYFFSVYKNRMDYRTIAIKDNDTIDSNYIDGKYTFEEINDMVTTKMEKGEEKKDYDGLMDKLITELMPIIENKIENNHGEATQTLKEKANAIQDDDLPF